MGSRLHGIFYVRRFVSAAFMTPSSRLAKTTASTNAEVSAIGPAYMTPIDSEEDWEDDDQRQQEEYLPCKRHDHTKPGFSNGSKKAGRHRLDPVGKGHQHEDAEIFFCKMKVQVAAVSEDAYDLMREELEADKK